MNRKKKFKTENEEKQTRIDRKRRYRRKSQLRFDVITRKKPTVRWRLFRERIAYGGRMKRKRQRRRFCLRRKSWIGDVARGRGNTSFSCLLCLV